MWSPYRHPEESMIRISIQIGNLRRRLENCLCKVTDKYVVGLWFNSRAWAMIRFSKGDEVHASAG